MILEDLQVYQKAMDLAEEIWALTQSWDGEQDGMKNQLRNCFDAWAINLSLGYGQYQNAEKLKHIHECKGQVLVAKTLLNKAHQRGFVPQENLDYFLTEIEQYSVRLNNYIKSVNRRGQDQHRSKLSRTETSFSQHEEDYNSSDTFAFRNNETDGYNQNLDSY